jgi:hypothetical protein
MPKARNPTRSSRKSPRTQKPQPQAEAEAEMPSTLPSDPAEPVYFWKPDQTNGFLGQWYPSPFTSTSPEGAETKYENAEQ